MFTGVLASIAVLIAFACGTSAAKSTTSGTQGGTLTIAETNSPSTFDPAPGQNAYSDFLDPAYAPLILQEPNGSFAPDLATKWKVGAGNKSISFTLRKGVRFSDGTHMTAAGVKAWIMHVKSYPGGGGSFYLRSLSSIKVSGNLSLTLNFSAATPDLEFLFSQVAELGEIGSPKTIGTKDLVTTTDGAGPYELDKAKTVTGATYTYVRNPYYWDPSADHWKSIVVKTITNPSAALAALKTGQVQIAREQPITNAVAAIHAGLKINAPLGLYMGLNLTNRATGPLSNVLVRQALNYAVNRSQIAKLLGVGYALPIDQLAVPGDQDYDKSLKNYYTYNPAKAKQLLAQAGYPNGFTLPVITINVVQQNVVAEILQEEFAQIGVTLQPTTATTVGEYATDLNTTTYPASTFSDGREPAAIELFAFSFPGAFNNPANSQFDTLLGQLNGASGKSVTSLAQQLQQVMVQQAWFVPVAATPLANFYRTSIAGVNGTAARPDAYILEYAPAKTK